MCFVAALLAQADTPCRGLCPTHQGLRVGRSPRDRIAAQNENDRLLRQSAVLRWRSKISRFYLTKNGGSAILDIMIPIILS